MTRDDIIRMARESFADPDGSLQFLFPDLIRFATLVAAAEREACKQHYEMSDQHIMDVIEASVAAEREACAKVCDEKVDAEYATGKVDHNEMGWTQACAITIRARSDK